LHVALRFCPCCAVGQPVARLFNFSSAFRLCLASSPSRVRRQDTTDAVEICMSQVLSAVPKAERELRQIEAEVATLALEFDKVVKQSAAALQPHVASFAPDGSVADASATTSDSAALESKTKEAGDDLVLAHTHSAGTYIDDLETLDFVKRNMEDTKALLHEAAAWERLVREMEVVVDGGDLSRVADHVALLQCSASALADMPDSERRAEVLASVNARFDSLVLPQLTDALTRDDSDALKRLVDVFGRLGRMQFLVKAFSSSRVKPLLDCWVETVDSASPLPEALGACFVTVRVW
jgi:hypothetical protein